MKIGVCGIGRAGRALVAKIVRDNEHDLAFVINREDSDSIGRDAGEISGIGRIGITVSGMSKVVDLIQKQGADVIIDFSNCYNTIQLLELVKNEKIGIVICTTHFEENGLKKQLDVLKLSTKGGVVYAPNLTLGINILINYVMRLSKMLPDFDFEIVERHRKDKTRPSTTANIIAKEIDRENVTIHSVRSGGYISVHEVTAASEFERITIEHESFSRDAFAYGAMLAAQFITEKTGYYEMKNVIEDIEKKTLGE